jgi:hypothetical protein
VLVLIPPLPFVYDTYGGLEGAFWCIVDACVSGIPGMRSECCVFCGQWLLKYIIYEILHQKESKVRKAMSVESFVVFGSCLTIT